MQQASNAYWLQDERLFQTPETVKSHGAHARILFLLGGFLFFLLMILGKISSLMVFHTSPRYSHTLPSTLVERGNIVDRNGIMLATNLITASAYANPRDILDPKEAAKKLSSLFPNLAYETLLKKLTRTGHFVWIKRNLTPQEQKSLNALGIPGIYYQREEKRTYPYHTLASHVIGFTNVDNSGMAGIERSFDEKLRENGSTVELSLDIRVQHILNEALHKGMEKFKAKGASGIILDTKNSEVVAMASLPDFDPNHPQHSGNSIFNSNTLGIYEMGSVFKIFTLAMALDAGKATLKSLYDTSKIFKVGKHRIKDFYSKNRVLSLPEVFMYSSTIWSVKMALAVGGEKQRDFLDQIGLLSPLSLEIGETGKPITPNTWGEITTATVSYGYGLAVSPLQLLNAVASIINGGLWHAPTLIKNANTHKPERRVLKAKTSEKMRRLLHLSVKKGSGKRSDAFGYLVGGKTGSANKTKGKGYENKNHHRSLFVGAFPMLKPRYVILIMLDEPQGIKETHGHSTGGWTAAPIAKEVIERAAPILGVLPVDEKSSTIQSAMNINYKVPGTPRVTR